MTDSREPWFEYSRPHGGKLSATPIHPIGWLLLFGAPFPAVLLGALVSAGLGKPTGVVATVVTLLVTLLVLFRLMVDRGRRRL